MSLAVLFQVVTVVVIIGGLAALAVAFADESGSPPPSAADELVAAYARSRAGTFVVEAEFRRTMADGRQLESAALVVQRPPDELRAQLGSASGRVGNRSLNCTALPDDELSCAPSGEVAPWDEMVGAEVANLQSYFVGDVPLYRAERLDPGCFGITQVAAIPDAPYGRRTTFCFDPATGALRRLELRREGGSVDLLRAVAIRPEVTDADLSLDDPARFGPQPVEAPG